MRYVGHLTITMLDISCGSFILSFGFLYERLYFKRTINAIIEKQTRHVNAARKRNSVDLMYVCVRARAF